MTRRAFLPVLAALLLSSLTLQAGSAPHRARTGMVVSQSDIASQVGWQVIKSGGNAIDAAVATAFALAVTHPTAGNIGGGGFLVYRESSGAATSYDFRERAPAGATPEMWLKDGKYDYDLHHNSHRSVGVPGTVAGLHMAWKEKGSKPWKDLVMPAVMLVFFFSMASGLNLYYFIQNLASLPQQWLIANERKRHSGPVVQGPART